MSVLREWLKNTYKVSFYLQDIRPRIVCEDGFSMSVQAGKEIYSFPRENVKSGCYEAVEIGYPNAKEELICEYAESGNYTDTIYPYVPVEVVEKVIEKHGGMKKE